MASYGALEQSRDALKKHHEKTAGAFAGVVGPRIEVCTAPCRVGQRHYPPQLNKADSLLDQREETLL
jgi:hypothetical protein